MKRKEVVWKDQVGEKDEIKKSKTDWDGWVDGQARVARYGAKKKRQEESYNV